MQQFAERFSLRSLATFISEFPSNPPFALARSLVVFMCGIDKFHVGKDFAGYRFYHIIYHVNDKMCEVINEVIKVDLSAIVNELRAYSFEKED